MSFIFWHTFEIIVCYTPINVCKTTELSVNGKWCCTTTTAIPYNYGTMSITKMGYQNIKLHNILNLIDSL